MPDNRGRYFDQATRDYHHALRRNQRRRATSVAKWTVVPWLIVATVILAVFCFWMVLVPFAPPNTRTCRHSIHSATTGSLNPELGQVKLSDLEIRSDQFLRTGEPSEDELAQIVRNNFRFPQARCHLRGDVLAVLSS